MSFDFSTLITDRSQADLDTLRALLSVPLEDWTAGQLAEFNQAVSKGAYNYTDLNRVISCMDYLNEILTEAGYVTGYHSIFVPHKAPEAPGLLPDIYTELEYVQSSGTQFINTGFIPDQDSRMVLDAQLIDTAGTVSIGGERYSTPTDAFTWISVNGMLRTYYNNGYAVVGSADTERHVYDKNKNETLIDNAVVSTLQYDQFTADFPIFLFASNENGTQGYFSTCKLHSAQLYDNGDLIKNFVPTERKKDGVVGFYDIEGGDFYTNFGTGAFISGPEVQPPTVLSPVWNEEDTPTVTQMTRYLQNVAALRGVLVLPKDTASVPTDMMGLTLTEANNIESILDVLQDWIINMQAAWFFSGDLYSGEA